ncbi:hypothetical protein HK104_006631 [Borealophlyctis nickersoniae]|nr:hypothetical protein HK104_006631 [Borealophlyctis nickersoniae]
MSEVPRDQKIQARERELARDIKLALRGWATAPHKLGPLLEEWENISSRDILVESANYISAQLSQPPPLDTSIPDDSADFQKLLDFMNEFRAMFSFRIKEYEDAMRFSDARISYEDVLKPEKYAFVTLLKAMAFARMGKLEDALTILERRQAQEEALDHLTAISSREALNVPVVDPKTTVAVNSDANGAVRACHDLHIAVLIALGREKEARLGCKQMPDGAERLRNFNHFSKRMRVDNIGDTVVEGWAPNPAEITRKV